VLPLNVNASVLHGGEVGVYRGTAELVAELRKRGRDHSVLETGSRGLVGYLIHIALTEPRSFVSLLELLAASLDGCTEAMMVAHGFTIDMLVKLRFADSWARIEKAVGAYYTETPLYT
jgi:hypothetical protein